MEMPSEAPMVLNLQPTIPAPSTSCLTSAAAQQAHQMHVAGVSCPHSCHMPHVSLLEGGGIQQVLAPGTRPEAWAA